MVEAVCFYLFSAVLLAAALLVVTSPQPIYSVLSLLVAMFCLASLFVMLGAFFVAAIQILLYAGAVLVLFLFAIMLLNLAPEALSRMRPFTLRAIGTLVGALFCVQLVGMLVRTASGPGTTAAATWTVREVARLLFTTYLLPFELTSFLILAAIIGAITLARVTRHDQ
ncbi:MAG TPA: hypothetical protein DDX89_01410 [Candidatus Omnitrophica bacterium]|nr:MAG: hypothetical protein A2Z92_06675 [Omnitrophica WOR_2 bacterium GWA2_63_20]OGX18270.1 MAG: hypothetical protein A2105_02185 [Omnitrophica WOR_2 bacterium GWF2_63_9]OGX32724.1 MAG: hypothetical protein A3E56_01405 [Omnitrophica WOR_2 bacterium RIFCSPHIGHO2_12_FULL_64_13]OGX34902.1 MAG: hypothetical protein A3B73_03810 [Omnitrophica WOR_2 bacterium RIFCSPHIGHO2_02_FULL_63_39]OGX46500.1 MAG: hypothetical protein A3I71_04840 [Omnitrophica WOR_2 bacterium RIFCSPLOWO2_02_FULL_63_16]OGX47497.1